MNEYGNIIPAAAGHRATVIIPVDHGEDALVFDVPVVAWRVMVEGGEEWAEPILPMETRYASVFVQAGEGRLVNCADEYDSLSEAKASVMRYAKLARQEATNREGMAP